MDRQTKWSLCGALLPWRHKKVINFLFLQILAVCSYLQFSRQVAGRIIPVLNDVIAFVDGLEEVKRISHTEERGQISGQ